MPLEKLDTAGSEKCENGNGAIHRIFCLVMRVLCAIIKYIWRICL